MADMIEAKDAKKLLGCDDAALNGYVNGGQIRAQRTGGKLMVSRADVEKVRKEKEDDGTIVLTGDSDDLSIDLGKVVDDSAETIVTKKATDTAAGTESITFGEDLEVVSFDDNSNTSEIAFDDKAKSGAGNLSFTDSNTAVMTAVDETAVGATTQPVEFQTGANDAARAPSSGSSRVRSARSQRAAIEEPRVHWFFTTCLVLTMLIGLFFIVPYFVIALFPHGDDKLSNRDRRIGLDDNAWTNMAGGIAGFSVEPNADRFKVGHHGDEYTDLKSKDPQAGWRYLQYRGDHKDKKDAYKPGDRLQDFVFEMKDNPIDDSTTSVKAASGMKTYPLRQRTVEGGPGGRPITEKLPDVFPNAAK